jgi:DNA polymerase-4
VTLKIKYADFQLITRRCTREDFLSSPEAVYRAACALLERTEAGTRPVRLAGISLSNFDPPGKKNKDIQPVLFKP